MSSEDGYIRASTEGEILKRVSDPTGPVARLVYNDDCKVCRWCARWAAFVWRNDSTRLVLVPWREGDSAPAFIAAYNWSDQGDGKPPYQPMLEVDEQIFTGELAVQMVHVLRWKRFGYWFSRWVALPGVRFLKRIARNG
jgi:hypothetical protein